MPEYTYHCPDCGAERDVVHSIRENPAIACAECGAAMARTIAGGGFVAVSGGKSNDRVERYQQAKEAKDVAMANNLVANLSRALRPKMREAALTRPLPKKVGDPIAPESPRHNTYEEQAKPAAPASPAPAPPAGGAKTRP